MNTIAERLLVASQQLIKNKPTIDDLRIFSLYIDAAKEIIRLEDYIDVIQKDRVGYIEEQKGYNQ